MQTIFCCPLTADWHPAWSITAAPPSWRLAQGKAAQILPALKTSYRNATAR